jgi:hypothetical protein
MDFAAMEVQWIKFYYNVKYYWRRPGVDIDPL